VIKALLAADRKHQIHRRVPFLVSIFIPRKKIFVAMDDRRRSKLSPFSLIAGTRCLSTTRAAASGETDIALHHGVTFLSCVQFACSLDFQGCGSSSIPVLIGKTSGSKRYPVLQSYLFTARITDSRGDGNFRSAVRGHGIELPRQMVPATTAAPYFFASPQMCAMRSSPSRGSSN